MDAKQRILLVHNELNRIEHILGLPPIKRGLFNWLRTKELEEKAKTLHLQRFNLVASYLADNDESYKRLVIENYRLLQQNHVHFKVYSTTLDLYSSYATKFSGKIHANGHAYCYTTEGNNPLNPIGNMLYPSRLEGHIDYFGNIRLNTASTEISMIATLPSAFEGTIDSNGRVVLRVVSRDTDILSGGMAMMNKLIANIFGTNDANRNAFASNCQMLHQAIEAFIVTL
jgi:hypothetical protein